MTQGGIGRLAHGCLPSQPFLATVLSRPGRRNVSCQCRLRHVRDDLRIPDRREVLYLLMGPRFRAGRRRWVQANDFLGLDNACQNNEQAHYVMRSVITAFHEALGRPRSGAPTGKCGKVIDAGTL